MVETKKEKQLQTIKEAFEVMKSYYLQTSTDRELTIKIGGDEEREVDELCL